MWNQGKFQSLLTILLYFLTLRLLTLLSFIVQCSLVSGAEFYLVSLLSLQVSVVGVVRALSHFATNVQYAVDDMTGPRLNVKQWVNEEDDAVMPFASPGTYVKVIGNLHSFSGQRSLLAMDIRCIDDPNEITSHMLEVVQAHMEHFGKVSQPVPPEFYSDSLLLWKVISCFLSQVLQVIRKFSHRDVGISLDDLRTQLDYLSMGDIRSSLAFLLNEGHVFSTIDEQHYKSAEP
uniref:Replication protein A C-terminal domain-containing protein n=1 Tax=Seriola lalandi dorsalis TaxID=1841481 RepID=A0A3B4Y6E7_SERLL